MVKTLSNKNFDEEISIGTTMVDFYADWCGACKMMSSIIEDVSKEISNVNVCKVNVDMENNIVSRYNIMSIPTFIIFKDGNLVDKFKGAVSKELLINKLNMIAEE